MAEKITGTGHSKTKSLATCNHSHARIVKYGKDIGFECKKCGEIFAQSGITLLERPGILQAGARHRDTTQISGGAETCGPKRISSAENSSPLVATGRGIHKYGVSPKSERTVDGIVFHSKREAKRYIELKHLEAMGAITDLCLQPVFRFLTSYRPDTDEHLHEFSTVTKYIGDFSYVCNGERIVEDVKGYQTPEFKRKKKIFEKLYPHLKLLLT